MAKIEVPVITDILGMDVIEEFCVMANSSIWELIKLILEIIDCMIKKLEASWIPTELEANSFNCLVVNELQYLKHFLKEPMSVWAII